MESEALEDWRGVDQADLRTRLRLSPAERVERLVCEVQVYDEIRQRVGVVLR